jgi:uncharacterized repeat protein (TIGR03803 family)
MKRTTKYTLSSSRRTLILLAIAITVFLGATVTSSLAQASTPGDAVFTRLHSFCARSNCSDGMGPGGLIQGLDGDFYGAASGGPSTSACPNGCGIIYKITAKGAFTTVYSFCSQTNCADGISPGSLLLGTDGNFYGITGSGGAVGSNCPQGCGTVFRLTPTSVLTTLYNFDPSVGFTPYDLIKGNDGNFYGVTGMRFFSDLTSSVFKLTPQGTATTLDTLYHTSIGFSFQRPDGTIYGIADPVCDQYCTAQGGRVFTMTPQGTMTTLYTFCSQTNCPDGSFPSVIQAADGNFYGTTFAGGTVNNPNCAFANEGCGTVFKLTPKGTLTTLYDFCAQANCVDGGFPGSLLQATDGNFYGDTSSGGTHGAGTLFEITPRGKLTTLYNFCSQSGCGFVPSGLIQATDGNFYGTTYEGGFAQWGTVFRLSTGRGPFVKTLPASGRVGAGIKILGTNLKGATAVSFNGTAAIFKVVSNSYITTTVPIGATTGRIHVTTPSGTLSSNVVFQVP